MAEELTEKLAEGATGRLEIIAELIVGGTLELTATGEHETVAASEAIVEGKFETVGGRLASIAAGGFEIIAVCEAIAAGGLVAVAEGGLVVIAAGECNAIVGGRLGAIAAGELEKVVAVGCKETAADRLTGRGAESEEGSMAELETGAAVGSVGLVAEAAKVGACVRGVRSTASEYVLDFRWALEWARLRERDQVLSLTTLQSAGGGTMCTGRVVETVEEAAEGAA